MPRDLSARIVAQKWPEARRSGPDPARTTSELNSAVVRICGAEQCWCGLVGLECANNGSDPQPHLPSDPLG
jgi:hypothetical protein